MLDPAQNNTFRDHYLDVPFDLSRVLFITTANVLDPIPGPLRDRMEVIELPGYTEEEKLQIARRYLVPRQIEENGLTRRAVRDHRRRACAPIIREYTREAGVRKLEREIGAVCRRMRGANRRRQGAARRASTPSDLADILGPAQVRERGRAAHRHPGIATGLAWTPVGGDILFIEATRMPGAAS